MSNFQARVQFVMRRGPLALCAALALLAFAACGGTTSTGAANPTGTSAPVGATIQLAAASFVQNTATISVGEALQFDDPASTGGPHMLCLGANQVCDASATGPTMLQSGGFRIMAGSPKVAMVFTASGVYHITCSLHPLMNLVVTVN